MRRAGRRTEWWMLPLLPVVVLQPPAPVIIAAFGAAAAVVIARTVRNVRAALRTERERTRTQGTQMRLGRDTRGRPVTLAESQLSAHGLILGASGAGKTTTLLTILSQHIERGGPTVAIDLKGSPAFARSLAEAAQDAGRTFRLWTPDGPSHWNPLAYGNATELKDKLMSTERFSEPHYARAAERYLQSTMQVLAASEPQRRPTLSEVVQALDSRRMQGLITELDGPLAERMRDYLSGLTRDQQSAVRGMATRLAIISESHTGRYLEPGTGPELDLRRALAGGEVVLFSLNSSRYGRLSAQLGTLAVQDLVSAVGHRLEQGGGPSALIAIDEFSALGSDNLLALLARGREAGASVLLATQELADLDRAAPGFREQVLGNTAVKIVHRQDVPSSAQTVSAMTGSERVWEDATHLTTKGTFGGRRGGTSRTQRLVDRRLVEADEIGRLRTGQAVLVSKLPGHTVTRVRVEPAAPRPSAPARSADGMER